MPRLSERERTIREGRAMMARGYRDAGWSIRAIAKELRVGIATIYRDLDACSTSVPFMTVPRPKRNTHGTPAENVVPLRRQA